MSLPHVTYQPVYQGHPINASTELWLGCREDILGKGLSILDYAVRSHSRVFFMRMDVRYPQRDGQGCRSDLFRVFMASFMTHLTRHGLSPLYLWVRERSESPTPHFHVALMLDGTQTRSAYSHWAKAVELWGLELGQGATGLIHRCFTEVNGSTLDGVMIERGAVNDQAMFDHCFHWMSYMAKENGKGDAPWHHREFGGSQVPRR